MFFACFRKENGEIDGGIYYEKSDGLYYDGWKQYITDTFNPLTENIAFIDFHIHGKTYQEKKDCLYNKVFDYYDAMAEYCFSYSELFVIQNWFNKNARRYGLLTEFKENCIC